MANRFLQLVPLVLFTGMATAAAGLMIGISWLQLAGIYLAGLAHYLLLIAILTGIGIIISIFHLGRKQKLLRAILGIGHSWLSREVILAGFFTALAVGIYILLETHQKTSFITIGFAAALISAVIMTWTIGMVYNLPGRFTWAGISNWAAPLVTAFLLGSYWVILFNAKSNYRFEFLFFMLWFLDFIMALGRAVTFRKLMKNMYRFQFPRFLFLTWVGHLARLILSFFLLTAIVFLAGPIVLFIIIGNIILDRLWFYTGTVGVSPKSEIAFQKAERMKQAGNAYKF